MTFRLKRLQKKGGKGKLEKADEKGNRKIKQSKPLSSEFVQRKEEEKGGEAYK